MKAARIACAVLLPACVSAGAFAGAARTRPAGEKVLLKRRHPPGRYVLTQVSDIEQTMAIDGEKRPKQHLSQTLVVLMAVDKPDEAGVVKMALTYRRFEQTMRTGRRVSTFASDAPPKKPDSPIAAAIRKLMKTRIVVEVGPGGKVRSVSGLGEMWTALGKTGPRGEVLARQLRKQLGDRMIKGLIEKQWEMIPARGVSVGETWRHDARLEVPFAGQVECRQQCSLKAVEAAPGGRIAIIEYAGKIRSDKEVTTAFGAIELTVDSVDMDRRGTVQFNVDTGMVAGASVHQTGTMVMSGKERDDTETEVRLDQEVKSKVTVRPAEAGELGPATRPAAGERE